MHPVTEAPGKEKEKGKADDIDTDNNFQVFTKVNKREKRNGSKIKNLIVNSTKVLDDSISQRQEANMEIGQSSGIKEPLIHNCMKNREDVPVLNDCNKKNTTAQPSDIFF
ncbi:hypothetical protein P3S67_003933 [Capsicum chacoense]